VRLDLSLRLAGPPAEVAGADYDAASLALFAAMETEPDDTRKGLIDEAIVALKSAGLWDKIDVLYVTAAHDAQAACLNWKDPANYTATPVNAPVFTTDRGFTGDGAGAYLSTSWNPTSSPGVVISQNSAHLMGWSRTAGQDNGAITGAGSNLYLVPRNVSDNCTPRINSGSIGNVSTTDGSGMIVGSRTSNTAVAAYRNGSSLGSLSLTSSALANRALYLLRRNDTSAFYWAGEAAAHAVGAGLSASEVADYYDALSTYMTAVGAA
jgi:hypothetical protein